MSTFTASISPTYRAQARRIRARFAGQPAAMHEALRALNRGPKAPSSTARITRRQPQPADPCDLPAAEWFTQLVEDRLDGPLLRYSLRQQLLRRADRLGIHRFEANLIIATIQHRRRHLVGEGADGRPRPAAAASPRRWRTAATALIAQGVILAAAWLLWPG